MGQYVTLYKYYGAWRSLVAHYTGGVGVVGSNPAAPTNFLIKIKYMVIRIRAYLQNANSGAITGANFLAHNAI